MKQSLLTLATLLLGGLSACAQEEPKAVDLGLSVKWAVEDIGPDVEIPEGWRLPTLAEIKELREACTQTRDSKTVKSEWGDVVEEWIVFTASNGKCVSFLSPMGSRSAREFGIAGSDGCYLKVKILNPLLSAPDRDGYYTGEELSETALGQRKYPLRLVKE